MKYNFRNRRTYRHKIILDDIRPKCFSLYINVNDVRFSVFVGVVYLCLLLVYLCPSLVINDLPRSGQT